MLTRSDKPGKAMNPTSNSNDISFGRESVGTLLVDSVLFRFVEDELLPAIGIESSAFWQGLESLIDELMPTNRAHNTINARYSLK